MIKRVCLERGCAVLIPQSQTRCEGHTRARQRGRDLRRGTPAERGYDATYLRLRRHILAQVPAPLCAYCNALADTVDHVVPLARGGRNELGNLVPACKWCNFSRGGRQAHR